MKAAAAESENPAPLAPALLAVLGILAANGPMRPLDVQSALKAIRRIVRLELLQGFPDMYPDHLGVDERGRLALLAQLAPTGDSEGADDDLEDWWLDGAVIEPLDREAVVVLDIETTGLDRSRHEIWQIGAQRLQGAESLLIEVACEGRPPIAEGRLLVDLAEALLTLDRFLVGAQAVAGHRLNAFDLPFISAAAGRAGVAWSCSLPMLDLHTLSLLVEPTASGRSLVELSERYGVNLLNAHQADSDVAATAGVINAMLDEVDGEDPSWGLVRRLLAEGGEAWARLLPETPPPERLEAVLVPHRDALAVKETSSGPSATTAARDGFRVLEAQRPGYRPRQSQLEMADAVASVLDGGGGLAVEAPTGTGKSLAYLIPAAAHAVRSGRPVVIATHTKVLQRQLREDAQNLRDLGLLPGPFRQIYGISNYLCTREIAGTITSREAKGTEWLAVAVAVRALRTAPNGVWDDVYDGLTARSDLGYHRRRQSLVTSAASCERQMCEHVERCPLYQRLSGVAAAPGIMSVSHALVASWIELSRAGGRAPGAPFGSPVEGEAPPVAPGAMIFDEAHNLEDSLTAAWTEKTGAVDLAVTLASLWGRYGPIRLSSLAASKSGTAIDDGLLAELRQLRSECEAARLSLGAAVGTYLHEFGGRDQQAQLILGVVRTRPEYKAVAEMAYVASGTLRRSVALLIRLRDELLPLRGAGVRRAVRRTNGAIQDLLDRFEVLDRIRDLADGHRFVHLLGVEGDSEDEVAAALRWRFDRIPIEVGDRFAVEVVGRTSATILTSATLTVGGTFDFLGSRLGIEIGADSPTAFRALRVPSPFDYDKQSRVILASHLPLPVPSAIREFCEDLAADQVGFLSLSGGKTLALFAARSRMEAVAGLVRGQEEELAARGVELLVQGEDPPARLTRRFKDNPGSVLYGLKSYWEGFDAPGETLSYLYIEKPPYPHPGDPVQSARQRALSDAGRDPFLEYVVPQTAIALSQGFGRLIRSEDDRGAAIFCDRRLQNPTQANALLLETLPTRSIHFAIDREDAWVQAITFVTGTPPDLTTALSLDLFDPRAILEGLRLLVGEDPTAKLRAAAALVFGIDDLRANQLELMRAVLGGRDALGFLPTGSGKSLCFQLPALLHADRRPFVVVSPLVALIKDQVDELRGRRGLRMVRGITGRTSAAERDDTLRDLAEGRIALLYVSPERLVRDGTLSAALRQSNLGALVVDEAHCVSSWGHDFRPEFRQVIKPVLDFERSPRLGLTATATVDVERDLKDTLKLDKPLVVRAPVDRPDLRYWVHEAADERDRTRQLLRFMAYQREKPGIVYASRRALTEELAWILRQTGVAARSYHAGMVPEQRDAVQDDFLAGTTQVIVATKAFGMGVNKPDIGWVVHYDLPESLESYAQEAGRAARAAEIDGDCLLLYRRADIVRRRKQAGQSRIQDVGVAQKILDLIKLAPARDADLLIVPDEVAEAAGIEPDDLNVVISWLEQVGVVDRKQDATLRGTLSTGRREPPERAENRKFFRLTKELLKVRLGTQRRFELGDLALASGMGEDELEACLIDWSLRRYVTFHATQRAWRIGVLREDVPLRELERVVSRWRALEQARVKHMETYATGGSCRRSAIARVFGDIEVGCREDRTRLCDVCARTEPFWHEVAASKVSDPEDLIDLPLVVLQAVRWATRSRDRGSAHRYSEVNLKAAVGGAEMIGQRPLSPALFRCPQFGAARYLRGSSKRIDEAVSQLVQLGRLARESVSYQGQAYTSLVLTNAGRDELGEACA